MIILKAKNISKSYQLGEHTVHALKKINFEVTDGEFLGIIGVSGSGKSTLLNLLGGLDKPDSGSVEINGIDFFDLCDADKSVIRNKVISYIFQSFHLVSVLNVYDNVMLPLLLRSDLSADQKKKLCTTLITDVGLLPYHHHLPHQLSGGQRQRVAIARALVTGAKIIFADEPTANLDTVTAHQIIDLMLYLNEKWNVTFIFCTHDEKLVSKLKRKLTLQDGECIEN